MTYYDEDGICHWCTKPVVADYFSVGLCEKHYQQEVLKDMQVIGFPL